MTKYHVLKKVDTAVGAVGAGSGEHWEIVARDIEGNGAEQALRKVASGMAGGVELVAVPSRSWAPVKVKIETHTSVKLT